jgi:DNA-binding response OmpR family regulator
VGLLKKSVLVVDDELHIARLLKIHLIDKGYEVDIATNARDAFNKAVKFKPSVITLDMMLTNGLDLMRMLKETLETRDIPIMVVTIADNPDVCYKAGASCFVQKPFDGNHVADFVEKLC